MVSVTLNLMEEDLKLIDDYIKFHGITMEKALITSFLEKLEDELDLGFFKNYKKDENEVLYTTEELKERLEI